MIEKLQSYIDIPIIIGGGIRDEETVYQTLCAGADLIVIGNALEQNPQHIKNMMGLVHNFSPIQVKRK